MKKCILGTDDMTAWSNSKAYRQILWLIRQVNDAVRGTCISHSPQPPLASSILNILNTIDQIVSDNPALPMQKNQRYGNPAFRRFHKSLQASIMSILEGTFPTLPEATRGELATYLLGSFGDPVRIDYGTGHELSFLAFLAAFEATNARPFEVEELQAMGSSVLYKYLRLVRRVQRTFSLEPAGSHGVWGLDDHQFIPFIWGSSQLIDAEAKLPPSIITDVRVIGQYAKEYHYFGAIEYIYGVKGPHFAEHSPLLYDISGIPVWERLNKGLLRMYKDEVLHKFPVVQHFEFGELLSWAPLSIYKISTGAAAALVKIVRTKDHPYRLVRTPVETAQS